MAEYTLDRSLPKEDFDWPAFIETLDLEEPFGEHYRIIPLNLPLLAEDMEKIRKGYTSDDFGSKYDLALWNNMLICCYNWGETVSHVLRFAEDGANYRICDVLENTDPDQRNMDVIDPSPESGSAFALCQLSNVGIRREYFDDFTDEGYAAWIWHYPPKRPRKRLEKLARYHPSIRSRFQRCFLKWLATDQTEFRVPVTLGKRSERCWQIGFEGITPQVKGFVMPNKIILTVECPGRRPVTLVSFETKIVWDGCFFTVDESSFSWYPRRNEAWEYCLFHKLWCWVHDILYFANWLVIADDPDGTSARLAVDRPAADERLVVIPLRKEERVTPLRREGSCAGVN